DAAGKVATVVDGIVEAGQGAVVRAAHAQVQVDIGARPPLQSRAQNLLPVVGLVAAEDAAVVFVEGIGKQRMAFQVQGIGHLNAAAQAHRRVPVAVAVGLVDEAARAPAGSGAAAGVDAVGALPRALRLEPGTPGALADARAGRAEAVVARAHAEVALHRAFSRPPGEDLHHAADRFGAVQARARPAHHFDAFDLLQRQVLERAHAGGGRADAHAVHQHQHVVG